MGGTGFKKFFGIMKIIPAIDIIDGKCVRLTQGQYDSCKIYSDSPLDMAKAFEDAGVTRLHLVDLDGAKAAGVVNIRVLETICKNTGLAVDFGGGIKSDEDIRKVFDAGAAFAGIGSIAQTDVEKTTAWLEEYGGENIIIGADVRDYRVCIQGWKKVTDTTIYELVENYRGKLCHLMCTDISRDGMLEGAAVELYKDLLSRYPELNVIASGGVGGVEDLERLAAAGIQSVIVGKAIYENRIKLEDLSRF